MRGSAGKPSPKAPIVITAAILVVWFAGGFFLILVFTRRERSAAHRRRLKALAERLGMRGQIIICFLTAL
jgi:hypothetical protein